MWAVEYLFFFFGGGGCRIWTPNSGRGACGVIPCSTKSNKQNGEEEG